MENCGNNPQLVKIPSWKNYAGAGYFNQLAGLRDIVARKSRCDWIVSTRLDSIAVPIDRSSIVELVASTGGNKGEEPGVKNNLRETE